MCREPVGRFLVEATMRGRVLSWLVALLVGVLLGFGASWSWTSRFGERRARSLAFVHYVFDAGLCARALGMMQGERPDKAREILGHQLVTSLREMDRITSEGSIVRPRVFPELLDGVREARAYARRNGLDGVAEADRALRRIGAR